MGLEFEGLDELIVALTVASDEIVDEVEKVVSKGCLNIKREAARRWSGYAHLPHLPRAVDYDVTRDGDTVTGEVGPNKAKLQGGLGAYIEFGTIHSGPIPAMMPAADAEAPRFERALADVAVELIERG
jgi:hypothetical protein